MLLARLFAWLDRALGGSGSRGLGSNEPGSGGDSALVAGPRPLLPAMNPPARAALTPHPLAALLSVDGGGQFLLCGAESLTLGHLRAARADLGFLADVGARHAELVRADSLQSGPAWRIVPCAGERVTVAGRPVPEGGARIEPGARVRLGENLEFRLHVPDPASASVVLELLHGAECAGARQIVLLARGAGGRVRVGAALAHHVRVPNLEFELELEWHGDALVLRCEEPLAGALSGPSGRLSFPPRTRLALTCGAPRGSRPPFGLSIEPVERLAPGTARA